MKEFITGFFQPFRSLLSESRARFNTGLVFFIIPILFILTVTSIHYSLGPFFNGRVDPEYFYMYNGIVLGAGNLSIQYYYHPGTPLHFIIAISARIYDLFQPGDYMKGFVDNPERYIHTANLFLNILVALVIWFSGIRAKKYTSSTMAAITMQLIPFGSAALLFLQGRLFADALLIIPIMLLCVLMLKYAFSPGHQSVTARDTILFGMVLGFGIASKLTFLPLVIIPLVMLKDGYKTKLKLLLYSGLFFLVFAYPVLFNIGDFLQWAAGKFSHPGQSGDGQVTYTGFEDVLGNLKILVSEYPFLFAIALLSLLLSLISTLKPVMKVVPGSAGLRKAIIAVNLALIIGIILTLKHFKLYYFAPFTAFTYVLAILTICLVLPVNKAKDSKLLKTISLVLFILFMAIPSFITIKETRKQLKEAMNKNQRLEMEEKIIKSHVKDDRPLIIAGPYYGTPFIEFAHFNGFNMTRNMKGFYTGYLKEKFPNSYHYVTWMDKFDFWDDFVDFRHILNQADTSFYVYIGKENRDDLKEIERRLYEMVDKERVTEIVLFRDNKSDEKLIEFIVNKN